MRSVSTLSFKYHHLFLPLQSSTFWKVLQITKLNALFPTSSSPRGRALAQFPKFVLEDKHRSFKFSTWEQLIKSSGKLKAGATVMFPWYMFCTWWQSVILLRNWAVVRKVWDTGFSNPRSTKIRRQGSGNLKHCTSYGNKLRSLPQPVSKWAIITSVLSP